jgi:hypothetical protein
MKYILMSSIAIMLAGCASTGVVPIGQDTFMISKQGAGGFVSVGSLKADIFQEASAYCISKKQTFQVVNTRDQPAGFGRPPEAEVQFMCLNDNDPEIRRPKLQKTADSVIEIRK